MKKRKVLGGVLFSLVLITLIILFVFLKENTTNKFINSETMKEFNNTEFKIKNELNFKVGNEEDFSGELVSSNGDLYLQKRNDDYKVVDKYQIVFEKGEAKKIKCDNLKDESIKEDIDEREYINGYKYEDLGNGKGQFFDLAYNKDFKVDLNKFNKDDMAKKTYGEYSHSRIVKDKIFFFIRRDPEKINLFSEDNSRYKELRWYDFNEEIWDGVKLSKNQHVESIIGIVDNKVYLTGTEEWGSQYPSKIYSADLKKKKVKEERNLNNNDDSYYDRYNLNEENLLMQVGKEDGEYIRSINLREKVFYELFKNEYPDRLGLKDMISPSKNKIFSISNDNNKKEVRVTFLSDGKPEGTVKVYDFEAENNEYLPQFTWSDDGKNLIIAECKWDKIYNFKILEFNQ
ncbi:hypothetical protein P5E62_00680 [Clostridium perfringens]|nr:hypothetical protein [Clostridium perfringens]MDK0710685.1 hypothetical protein [Clostridium perfringens]